MSASFLFPSDGALVGSKELLDSPNVVDPTNAVNEPIPTPSTYVDGRGEICNTKISVGDDRKHDLPERINILYTRKGMMRSGDIHSNFQCDFIFGGSVEVWTLLKDGSTKKVTYGSKQYVEIPPYTPHIFHFVADTVMAEWWEGRQGSSSEFRAWFYSPYRSIVEQSWEIKALQGNSPGKLKRYKEITNVGDNDGGDCKEKNGRAAMSPPPQVLLLDGGVSTHLESKLSDPFAHRELWSSSLLLTRAGRDSILKAHRDFLSAGADIISTVTYQAHYMPLPGKEDDTSRLRLDYAEVDTMLVNGVRLAKEAVKQHQERNGTSKQAAYVAASIGSLGGSLADGSEYTGNFGSSIGIGDIESFHTRKLKLLAGEHPDIVAFETIPCIEECRAILNVLKQQMPGGFRTERDAPNIPPACWLSFACSDEEHLNDGSNLRDALALVEKLDPEGVLLPALGVNCCSFKDVKALTGILVEHIMQPGNQNRSIVLYPNSGEVWDAHNEAWLEGTGTTEPEDFAQGIMATVRDIHKKFQPQEIPSIIVGGCCRTTPETIAAIRDSIDAKLAQSDWKAIWKQRNDKNVRR